MRITEIFFSIQGESTHAGKPCVFVRLTGCSLRCVYCDTKYAYAGGREMSLQEVLGVVAGHPAKLVEVTGGEPLEQEEVYLLMSSLLDRGYTVMLETGGHHSVVRVPKPVIKVIDIKCPDSREGDTVCWDNIELAGPHGSDFEQIESRRSNQRWNGQLCHSRHRRPELQHCGSSCELRPANGTPRASVISRGCRLFWRLRAARGAARALPFDWRLELDRFPDTNPRREPDKPGNSQYLRSFSKCALFIDSDILGRSSGRQKDFHRRSLGRQLRLSGLPAGILRSLQQSDSRRHAANNGYRDRDTAHLPGKTRYRQTRRGVERPVSFDLVVLSRLGYSMWSLRQLRPPAQGVSAG